MKHSTWIVFAMVLASLLTACANNNAGASAHEKTHENIGATEAAPTYQHPHAATPNAASQSAATMLSPVTP